MKGFDYHIMTLTTGEYPCRNGRIRNDEIESYFIPMENNHVSLFNLMNKGNNKITELRTILQRESQNS